MSGVQYREFNALIRESWTWTPENHKVDRMRELLATMKAPTPMRHMELRLVERRLGLLEPTTD